MSTPTPVTVITDLQQLEQILKIDLLSEVGTPLIQFLANIQTNTSAINIAGQWIAFVGQIIAAGPKLLADAEAALANFLQNKIAAWQSASAAAAKK